MAEKKRLSDKFILVATLATTWGIAALSIGGAIEVSVQSPKAAEVVLTQAGMKDIQAGGQTSAAANSACTDKWKTFNPTPFTAKKDGEAVEGTVCFNNVSNTRGKIVYKPLVRVSSVTFKPFQ